MNSYFDTVNRSLGWGDLPKDGLLFIGLEEACGWRNTEEDRLKIAELQQHLDRGLPGEPVLADTLQRNRDKLDGKRMSDVPRIMSKIIVELGFDRARSYKNADDYLFNRLFQEGSRVFQANLYPLGKSRLKEKVSEEARELFGINLEEYSQLISNTNSERFIAIREFKKKYGPSVTICFGKAGWDDFRAVFELNGKPVRVEMPFEIYESERVILTPFFWNRDMHTANIKALAGHISGMFQNRDHA